ncbi:hypothetical protein GCM10027168_64480 [Streptomyces capparidis]
MLNIGRNYSRPLWPHRSRVGTDPFRTARNRAPHTPRGGARGGSAGPAADASGWRTPAGSFTCAR